MPKKADKGNGERKNYVFFADVLYGWPLTAGIRGVGSERLDGIHVSQSTA